MSSVIQTIIPCINLRNLFILILSISLILNFFLIYFLNVKNCLQHLNETSNDSGILPNTSGLSMYLSKYHSVERTVELLEQNRCSKPVDQVIKISDIDDFEGKFKDKICIPEFIVIKKCNENITSYCGDDSGKNIGKNKCLPVKERDVNKTHQIEVFRNKNSDSIMEYITFIDNYECQCQ